MAWTAPALPPRVRDALGMAVAAARQSQPGMFATLSVREGVLLALFAGAYALLGRASSGLLIAALMLCGPAVVQQGALVLPWLSGVATALPLDAGGCLAIACGFVLAYLVHLVSMVAWFAWGCGAFLDDRRVR